MGHLFWAGNFAVGKFAFLTEIPPLSLRDRIFLIVNELLGELISNDSFKNNFDLLSLEAIVKIIYNLISIKIKFTL